MIDKETVGKHAMQIYLRGGKTWEQACREAEHEFQINNQVPKNIKDLFGGIFK